MSPSALQGLLFLPFAIFKVIVVVVHWAVAMKAVEGKRKKDTNIYFYFYHTLSLSHSLSPHFTAFFFIFIYRPPHPHRTSHSTNFRVFRRKKFFIFPQPADNNTEENIFVWPSQVEKSHFVIFFAFAVTERENWELPDNISSKKGVKVKFVSVWNILW